MKIKTFVFNRFQENTYAVENRDECFIVDPGFSEETEKKELLDYLESGKLKVKAILLTHSHLDHILGVKALQDLYGCPVYASTEDRSIMRFNAILASYTGMPKADDSFTLTPVPDSGEVIAAGMTMKLISTPGHTPGSVCWYSAENGILFTGDTLMKGTIGRTDLSGGDYDKEIVSIMDGIMALPAETEFFPGHGPSSTLSEERTQNPMLEPFNEPDQDYNV